MKTANKIVVACLLSMGTSLATAQTTIYDANRWMTTDLNGTARFVGMGGAMGALGGDISTMGTNPAGIGIYRSNDVMISFGVENTKAKSALGMSQDKTHASFDNAGFVFSAKIGNNTALRFANFGFNYRRLGSFNRSMLTGGTFAASQTLQMADMLNYDGYGTLNPPTEKILQANDVFHNPEVPWLGALAYNAGAGTTGTNDQNGLLIPHYITDAGGNAILERYYPYMANGDQVAQNYRSKESGGIHSFDINGALNFYDRFYIGATLGLYSIDYDRRSTYDEDFTGSDSQNYGGYTLTNRYWADGSGVDFKLGIIVRPFEDSSFRFGLAVHTPTLFSVTERNSASIDYALSSDVKGNSSVYDTDGYGMDGDFQYKVVTPWKFNASLGYTVGSAVALGAEYEYADRSAGKIEDPDGYEMGETTDMQDMMKAMHTIRVGAEIRLAREFSLRLGYNYITAPFKNDAYKYLPYNSIRTDTEYANLGATNNYTAGLGYRGKSFYADLAYRYNTYKETFYAFHRKELSGGTEITNSNHKLMLTLGLRF
ncbi:MAG: hypothetical protein LBN29_02455 [Mediterranea sp.]|jgi:hypothetical protein|nr:hypothetical protein [Mediterranea sp.]